MFEWLPWIFLAALAFFGMGWLVARIDIKQLLSESRALPQSYFKGLNFLMTGNPTPPPKTLRRTAIQKPRILAT